ncbi:hypothetical protein LINGRAHAP2_LOCUS16023 [Linum grandiflorum]
MKMLLFFSRTNLPGTIQCSLLTSEAGWS